MLLYYPIISFNNRNKKGFDFALGEPLWDLVVKGHVSLHSRTVSEIISALIVPAVIQDLRGEPAACFSSRVKACLFGGVKRDQGLWPGRMFCRLTDFLAY